MSGEVVIRAEGLGKKYVIGHQSAGPDPTLRDAIVRGAAGFARAVGDMARGRPIIAGDELEDFWALQDVSFEVRRGEVVGVIGRNGAGKSTLLKVLSRITEPSAGRVEIRGRVASLLEVGTGFHPELTGRENIFLNGAILGMPRSDIRRRFDEIVAFADVERFLDTPVKRYSSGMYVRLAFSVAAHLEPEILIVDEVLAVGDAAFQKKCLGKMHDVATEGRTVLFVSHNMGAVQQFCERGILIEGGRKVMDDTAEAAVAHLLRSIASRTGGGEAGASANGAVIHACTADLEENEAGEFDLRVVLCGSLERPRGRLGLGVAIRTVGGMLAANIAPMATNFTLEDPTETFTAEFVCRDISKCLNGGEYIVDAWLSVPNVEILVHLEAAAYFSLPGTDPYGTGQLLTHDKYGIALLPFSFAAHWAGSD